MTNGNNAGPCVGTTREWGAVELGAKVLLKGWPLCGPSRLLLGGTQAPVVTFLDFPRGALNEKVY